MTTGEKQPGLRIERRFDVSPDIVFETLTVPDKMRVWWGDNVEFDIDLRVGGRWTIVRQEGGQKYLATGEYLEVDRPSQLAYTFAMPKYSPNNDTIRIRIETDGEGSIVVFEHVGPDIAVELAELPEGESSATEAGWQQGFDLMAAAWSVDN